MLTLNVFVVTYISVFIFSIVNSARILAYYPTPSISHQVAFRPLTNELVRRGHHVTVITANPQYSKEDSPVNLTEVDVQEVSYKVWKEQVFGELEDGDLVGQMETIMSGMNAVYEAQFKDDSVRKVLSKTNEYDLLILEAYSRTMLYLSHIFKVPVIQFSSYGPILDTYQFVGFPRHELLYPTCIRKKIHDLSIFDTMIELFRWFRISYLYYLHEEKEHSTLEKVFGENVPPMSELANNIDVLFLNVHPIFAGIRPVPPNVIHFCGIHQKPEKELPKELKITLDSSKNGVIYISFGTNIKADALPSDKIQVLKKVMSMSPYDFLWKWDEDKMMDKPKNVIIDKWFPQADLLRHPKIKLFITQGGLQSTDEAIEAGVPLLGVPMMVDQWFNVEQYTFFGIGIRLDMHSWTEDSLGNAVETLIQNESYRQNISRLKSIMHMKSETSLERAIWWTEYVLKHKGAKQLRSPSANMHWMEYFDIKEVITIVVTFVLLLIAVSVFSIVTLFSCATAYIKRKLRIV